MTIVAVMTMAAGIATAAVMTMALIGMAAVFSTACFLDLLLDTRIDVQCLILSHL